jgi:hypothetical protein
VYLGLAPERKDQADCGKHVASFVECETGNTWAGGSCEIVMNARAGR